MRIWLIIWGIVLSFYLGILAAKWTEPARNPITFHQTSLPIPAEPVTFKF